VTDTSEKGLETLIVTALAVTLMPRSPSLLNSRNRHTRGVGYNIGDPRITTGKHAVDLVNLLAFLNDTQPKVVETLGLDSDGQSASSSCIASKVRLQRGVIDVSAMA